MTDEAGNVYRGDDEIGEAAEGYFTNLFKSTRDNSRDNTSIFHGLQGKVTPQMNQELQRMVTEAEIQKAVFDIGSDRASRPDGITAAFYQQFWPDVKNAVITEIQRFFQEGIMRDSMNHTNICLIPKKNVSTSMADFRPIALCNVSYKIISKILVDRLKQHLPFIVSENQAAFIGGRNIMDNVIIAHEMLHSLKKRKLWATSYMTVKTDITKAYDRLEWAFLRETMQSMGFDSVWINWVMQCVESVSFSVLVNASPRGMIKPERGIRQGDPLSPYLFILCAEVLSNLLTKAEESNKLKGMKISTTGPSINHLLFADDALFFCHAHQKSCTTIMSILREYEQVSGQAVNLNKSAITFGARVKQHVKTRLRHILNIHNDGGGGKYLGLPEQIGSRKKEIFNYVVDKVKQRTQNWSHKFLSKGGKEILLKTIAIALPVYTMNVFKLPKGICDKINSTLARYWWSKSRERRGMHWISWKRMSLPKKEGGLGFKDIEKFNLALLGKQVWRILQSPNSFLSRLLKARYFPNNNVLTAGTGYKPSFIWKSLLEGRELLKTGMRYLIGNGHNTSAWLDPWLPLHPPRPPECMMGTMDNHYSVSDLMNEQKNGWNLERLRGTVTPEDIQVILNIRISPTIAPDLLGWHYNDSGLYTVKSGYWLATHMPGNEPNVTPSPGLHAFKTSIWRMKTTPKIQHFLWRILSNALAAGTVLVRRNITTNSLCKRCNRAEETIEHLFFYCEYVQEIWRRTAGLQRSNFDASGTFTEKFESIIDCYNNHYIP